MTAPAREYLESFAVQEAITQALGDVIAKRPVNPVKAIGKYLIEQEEKRDEVRRSLSHKKTSTFAPEDGRKIEKNK